MRHCYDPLSHILFGSIDIDGRRMLISAVVAGDSGVRTEMFYSAIWYPSPQPRDRNPGKLFNLEGYVQDSLVSRLVDFDGTSITKPWRDLQFSIGRLYQPLSTTR